MNPTRLRIVREPERPLAALSRAEKLAKAIAYLRQRGKYVLDIGSAKPRWGVCGELPERPNPLLTKIEEMDRRRA